ncbi:hypothetical protein L4X34_15490 [Phocaeicola vulgatus]|nr:hypothetical protein [Phocaeicola vulgatus]MCG0363592.1 hypothetical protein [Phocaeicola vulgatus]
MARIWVENSFCIHRQVGVLNKGQDDNILQPQLLYRACFGLMRLKKI